MRHRVYEQDNRPEKDAVGAPGQATIPIAARATDGLAWLRLQWLNVLLGALAALLVLMLSAVLYALVGSPRNAGNVPRVDSLATAIAQATPAPTATTSGLTSAPVPSATVKFGAWPTDYSQQCNGAQALPGFTITLDNMQSSIAIDWWLDIQGRTADGKAAWASADVPYGTTLVHHTQQVNVYPDSRLCAAMQGATSPVSYHAYLDYAGLGQVAITDTITPPTVVAIPTATSTPTQQGHHSAP